jgi:hypothetical protein
MLQIITFFALLKIDHRIKDFTPNQIRSASIALTFTAKIKSPKRLTKQPLFAHLFPLGSSSLFWDFHPNQDYPICAERKMKWRKGGARRGRVSKQKCHRLIPSFWCQKIFALVFLGARWQRLDALCEMSFLSQPLTWDISNLPISKPQFHICAIETAAYIVKKGMWASNN